MDIRDRIYILIIMILVSSSALGATVFELANEPNASPKCRLGMVRAVLIADDGEQDLILHGNVVTSPRFALVIPAPAQPEIGTVDYRILPALDLATDIPATWEFRPHKPSDVCVCRGGRITGDFPPSFHLIDSGCSPTSDSMRERLSSLELSLDPEAEQRLRGVGETRPYFVVLVFEAIYPKADANKDGLVGGFFEPVLLRMKTDKPWLPMRGDLRRHDKQKSSAYILSPSPLIPNNPGTKHWQAFPFGPRASTTILEERDISSRWLEQPPIDPIRALDKLGREWLQPGSCCVTRILCRAEQDYDYLDTTLSPHPYHPNMETSDDPYELTRSIIHLGLESDSAHAGSFRNILANAYDSPVLVAATAWALGECGNESDITRLEELSEHIDPSIRLEAQRALTKLSPLAGMQAWAREFVRENGRWIQPSRDLWTADHKALRVLARESNPDLLPYLETLAVQTPLELRERRHLRLVQAACGDPVAHDELCEAIITAPEARIKPLNWRTADNNENNWRRLENAHPLYFEHHPDGWLIFSRAMGYLQTRPEYRDTILRRLLSDDRLSDARQLLVLHMLSNPTRQDHEKLLSIFHRTRVHWPDHSRSRQAWDASQTTLRYNPVALACLQTMARFGLSNELISVWERSRGKDPLTCWMALVAMGGSDDPVYLDAFRKHARNEWWAYARSKKAWRGFDCDNRNRAIGRLSRLEWDPFAALEFVSQYLKKHDPQWSPSAIAADSLAPPPLRLEFLGRHYKSKHERVADETSIRRAYEMLLELDTGRDCWPDMVRENMALTRHWMEKEKSLLGRLEYYMGDTQSEP